MKTAVRDVLIMINAKNKDGVKITVKNYISNAFRSFNSWNCFFIFLNLNLNIIPRSEQYKKSYVCTAFYTTPRRK